MSATKKVQTKTKNSVTSPKIVGGVVKKVGVRKWVKIASLVSYCLALIMSLALIIDSDTTLMPETESFQKGLVLAYGIVCLLPIIFSLIWVIKSRDILSTVAFIGALISVVVGVMTIVVYAGSDDWNLALGFGVAVEYGVFPLLLSCALALPSLIGLKK